MKSTVTWDGDKLVVNSKLNFQGNDVTVKSVWSLSADGNTMTQNQHLSAAMGEADQTMVFEKQAGGAAAATGAAAPVLKAAKASGGAKADYSGKWKLNVAKSDFGVLPGFDSRVDVIDHKEPVIKADTSADGPQGKQDYSMTITTDGKEATNSPGGLEQKAPLVGTVPILL